MNLTSMNLPRQNRHDKWQDIDYMIIVLKAYFNFS